MLNVRLLPKDRMAKVANVIKVVLPGALLIFFLGFGIGTTVGVPEHAIVLVDSDKRVYWAPSCVLEMPIGLTKATIGEAREADLSPDPGCRDTGAFTQEVRSPSGMLLETIGVLDPIKSRWNKDGSWNITPGVSSPALNETPKPMLKNVHALTEAAAVLNICFESPSYKTLSNEKALEVHGLLIRIGDLVQAIGTHYRDDALYTTYEMTKVSMSSDPELKEYAKRNYQVCSEKLFREMDSYLIEIEKIVNGFLKSGRL